MQGGKDKIIKMINNLMDQASEDELKEYFKLLTVLVKNFT